MQAGAGLGMNAFASGTQKLTPPFNLIHSIFPKNKLQHMPHKSKRPPSSLTSSSPWRIILHRKLSLPVVQLPFISLVMLLSFAPTFSPATEVQTSGELWLKTFYCYRTDKVFSSHKILEKTLRGKDFKTFALRKSHDTFLCPVASLLRYFELYKWMQIDKWILIYVLLIIFMYFL